MCRFVLYQGPKLALEMLTTLPKHSIVHQSYKSELRSEPLNGDGFGIAWYAPEYGDAPAVFRSITPAWSNQNLANVTRVTSSNTILAHVRAASPGLPVIETNCHPFTHGKFSFMHNGYIPDFHKIKRHIQQKLSDEIYQSIQGSTDSEHIFALFLQELSTRTNIDNNDMRRALSKAAHTIVTLLKEHNITEPAQLNLAVSDGVESVVCRFSSDDIHQANSLFWHDGAEYICKNGVCSMQQPYQGHGAVIIASEPLSNDVGWSELEMGACISINKQGLTSFHRLLH
jgi:glutamine amidotransferase